MVASQINFSNHIKRLKESMRGVQRILYIGTKIDLKEYPTRLVAWVTNSFLGAQNGETLLRRPSIAQAVLPPKPD